MISSCYPKQSDAVGMLPDLGPHPPFLVLKGTIDQLSKEIERLELAKSAYQESEVQLDGLFDSVGECMTIIDHDLYIIWSNKAGRELFGDSIVGGKCYQVYHKQNQPCPSDQCPAMLTFRDGQRREYNTRVLGRDGRSIDLHCTFNIAIRGVNGAPTAVISVARDITERVRIETIIRRSKREWERTFDAIGELVVIHDPEGRIVRCNQAFRHATDLPWKELIGRPCHEVFCGQSKECALCPLERTIQDGQRHSSEIPGPDHKKAYWVSTYPILDEGNRLDMVIRTLKDLSEIKSLEAQVRQAQKMEAIGTLAGGISHDFNTVLTAIHGFTELTAAMIPPEYEECHENLARVLEASQRGKGLIKQILTFSRRNDGFILQPVLLEAILQETLAMMRASISKKVEIKAEISCGSAKVMADPTQIHQVVMNLCTNASQAMGEKGGLLEVSLENVLIDAQELSPSLDLRPGLYCLLTVRDRGEGMDQATMSRIFEPFFTTKPEGVGTGMGLSVVHGIVKAHKGAIRVTSEKGRGTCFYVYLPALIDLAVNK